jgi:hypothetical protein
MYKKEIVTHEYVYSEQEQERLKEIRIELKRLCSSDFFASDEMAKLVDEMREIIIGEWSPPMPF